MTPQDIIIDVQNKYAEHLEMHNNPDAMVSGILAHKIVSLLDYITYLEKRLSYESNSRSNAS